MSVKQKNCGFALLIPLLFPSEGTSFFSLYFVSLFQVAESFLGSDVFHVQTADRLLMFLWAVIDRLVQRFLQFCFTGFM